MSGRRKVLLKAPTVDYIDQPPTDPNISAEL